MASKATVVTLVPIKDMDRALDFYTKVLGGSVGERADGEMKDHWASVRLGSHDLWLITPTKREKRELAYTTLLVSNITSYVAGLTKKGVKFQKAEKLSPETKVEGPIAREPFGASAFFKDSEGNVLMVWQNAGGM